MKGIHPEFLLGLKGGEVEELINDINLQINQDTPTRLHEILDRHNVKDKTLRQRLMFETEQFSISEQKMFMFETSAMSIKLKTLHRFQDSYKASRKSCIYHPSKAFFNAVSGLNREVPFKYLGVENNCVFMKIPKITINGANFVGAYVYMIGEMMLVVQLVPDCEYTIMGSRVVMICDHTGYLNLSKSMDRELEPRQGEGSEKPEDATTVIWSDMIFTTRFLDGGDIQKKEVEAFNRTIVGIVNTAIYIHSQDPVIEELQPLKKYDKKQLGQLDKDKRENLCTLPVRLINWQYHTGRQYNVDETFVGAHLRWQPCGPERKEVKLVWVKEHKRTYGKESSAVLGTVEDMSGYSEALQS